MVLSQSFDFRDALFGCLSTKELVEECSYYERMGNGGDDGDVGEDGVQGLAYVNPSWRRAKGESPV
jgi:hypothetical protein